MKTIEHNFVEFIPGKDVMKDGVIYVSFEYDTAVHNCLCGCGEQVVTPLSPTDWKLTYNGETISIYPSIGNWGFECRSHYWIRNGKVIWADIWSEQRILSGRKADQRTKVYHYEQKKNENGETLFHKLKAFLNRLLRW